MTLGIEGTVQPSMRRPVPGCHSSGGIRSGSIWAVYQNDQVGRVQGKEEVWGSSKDTGVPRLG